MSMLSQGANVAIGAKQEKLFYTFSPCTKHTAFERMKRYCGLPVFVVAAGPITRHKRSRLNEGR